MTLTVRAGCVSQLTNSQYSIRSGSTAAVTGPPVVTTVAAASLAPIDVTVSSSPVTRMPPLQRGDVVQHVITLRNTVSESRPFVSIQLSAGRGARFDQVIDAAGWNVRQISPQILEWSGSLAADAAVSIIVTTRMEDCLGPSDTFTQLNDGRPIQVLDVCNRLLGSQSPPPPFNRPAFASLAVGAAGDIYLGRHTNGSLGVLHGITPPTGGLLTLSPNIIDLEFIDPAAAPPPPPPSTPVNIDITEAVLVTDGADLVAGVVLDIDEPVSVSDAANLLPGMVPQIDEQVARVRPCRSLCASSSCSSRCACARGTDRHHSMLTVTLPALTSTSF